jgi:hypothetical protein
MLVVTDHIGEKIIETGSKELLLELADVNEDTRPLRKRRDKTEAPGVVPLCESTLLLH